MKLCNFVAQQSCATKFLNFVACLTWDLASNLMIGTSVSIWFDWHLLQYRAAVIMMDTDWIHPWIGLDWVR